MMRGRKTMVTVVRQAHGELAIDVQPLSTLYAGRLRRTPFVRGIIVLIESLVLGIKSLFYSANAALEEEEEKLSGGLVWIMMVVALGLAVALFFIVPLLLTKLLHISSSLLFNLVDGLIRVAIFIAYIKLVALLPDIKRVFAYHGAEHKAVNAYEAGVPLEPEVLKNYSKAHMRCGTSFLFAVVIISIIVFALFGLHTTWLMVLSRIILVPVIAALGYEVIYFGGRHASNRFVRIVLAPGLWLQALTTREPDDSQLEVAIVALKKVMELDEMEATAQPAPQ